MISEKYIQSLLTEDPNINIAGMTEDQFRCKIMEVFKSRFYD